MRTAPVLGAALLALLVILAASLGVESGRAQWAASTCTESGKESAGGFVAQAGLGVKTPRLLYDGVKATVTPLTRATGLSGCEKTAGLVAIGESGRLLYAMVYAHSRLPGKFVPKYGWATGGYMYSRPALAPGIPWNVRTSHTLRLVRVRPSYHWLVYVDGAIMNRIVLPGSERGLALPRALIYADNRDSRLNRGSFRFDRVLVRPVGSRRWTQFPRGKTWLYTDHAKYTYVKLPVRTSFIAKSR
jgi:hypothetical protein